METKETALRRLQTFVAMAVGDYYFTHPEIFEVLHRIPRFDRKVLAIWAYKRFEHKRDIRQYWTWDSDRIKQYQTTDEHKPVDAAVASVRKEFAEIRSGYKLTGSPEPRPLKKQIDYWNDRKGIGEIATDLESKLLYELRKDGYTEDYEGYEKFNHLLSVRWAGGMIKEPTNAVPGLSAHGQMRAIDFHVLKNGTLVAGSGGASNWRVQGFAEDLKKAIKRVNGKYGREVFDGPLKSPDEPWHYTYVW